MLNFHRFPVGLEPLVYSFLFVVVCLIYTLYQPQGTVWLK